MEVRRLLWRVGGCCRGVTCAGEGWGCCRNEGAAMENVVWKAKEYCGGERAVMEGGAVEVLQRFGGCYGGVRAL